MVKLTLNWCNRRERNGKKELKKEEERVELANFLAFPWIYSNFIPNFAVVNLILVIVSAVKPLSNIVKKEKFRKRK
jgi:hypothetical protein